MTKKRNVHISATGGTIAGRADSASATVGYKAGELTIEQLMASVPGLDKLANLTGEQLCNIDSKDMQEDIWLKLARCVEKAAARDDVDGIVITHGTDTMEETAYFLQLVLKTEKPVVLTGAMRPATAISADGPMNIWQSVQVAADASAKGRGVLVVMNGQIDAAEKVTKINVNALQAFQSPGFGPVGRIVDENIFWQTSGAGRNVRRASSNTKLVFPIDNLTQLPKVRLIYGYVGGDDDIFVKAALQDGAKGLVYAACGNGSVPEKLMGVLREAVASGVPVVIATRCGGGVVVLSEEMTEKNGFIASGPLNPQKAKILLQLALTKTKDVKEIQEIFKTGK
ncbi:MAG: asparaginase [Succiniclasticum sp.]